MSGRRFLTDAALPFCDGCGHRLVTQNTEKALQKLGSDPLDVILVTDIGCHGIVDESFLTHTVHGLHGRAVALASGISAGLDDPAKKVIAFVGDGGATIGMQHLVGAAHRGFDITIVVHNNMLYGMTGGQPSDATPCGFKTPAFPQGNPKEGYDICQILTAAGASYVQRVLGIGDYSDALASAFSTKGLSLVEVMEICPSYGVKSNPGMKLKRVVEDAGLEVRVFVSGKVKRFSTPFADSTESLLSDRLQVPARYDHGLDCCLSIITAGSAGEGVQTAAECFAKAAMMCGLDVTLRGSYPVTVGVGFSASQVNLSPRPIVYTGAAVPDVLIITSADGAGYARGAAGQMSGGLLLVDQSLDVPQTSAEVARVPFRERAGPRNSAAYGLLWYLNREGLFPVEALKDALVEEGFPGKARIEKLLQF